MLVFIMSEINVLYCFDNNFWQMAAVSISSLIHTKSVDTTVNVYCMVAPHTRGRRKIEKIIGQGGNLIWKTVPKKHNPYANHDYSRWSPVIFYRLFAHNVFPDIDKLLYIDSDTLILSDLTELYDTDVTNYAFGAVRDMAPIHKADNPNGKYVREFKEKYLKHDLYINSGVLLLNLPYLRTTKTPWDTKCKLTYPDQDILNTAFDGQILELPLRYNCIPEIEIDEKFPLSERNFVKEQIYIAHFYAAKPYYYDYVGRETYSMFAAAARKIGFYPEDFVRQDIKRHRKKARKQRDAKTIIPFLRFDKHGRLRFFGVKI